MIDEHISAEVFPAWQYIADELRSRGWSKKELARRMGVEHEKNLFVLDFLEHCPLEMSVFLDDETAEGLALAFGTSKELWLNLDKFAKTAIRAGRALFEPRITRIARK